MRPLASLVCFLSILIALPIATAARAQRFTEPTVTLRANRPSPQDQMTPVTWVATVTDGTPPFEYRWEDSRDNGATWSTWMNWCSRNCESSGVRAEGSEWHWTPALLGPYLVRVTVRMRVRGLAISQVAPFVIGRASSRQEPTPLLSQGPPQPDHSLQSDASRRALAGC